VRDLSPGARVVTVPAARTRVVDGRRHYDVTIDGTLFYVPSASSLVGLLAKPAIQGWDVNRHLAKAHELYRQARNTDEVVFRRLVRSSVGADGNPQAESGTRAHECIEAYFLGDTIPEHEEAEWAVAAAKGVEAELQLEPLPVSKHRNGVELTVVRVEDGIPVWAGTSDMIGRWKLPGARRWSRGAVDWKSGASGLWPDALISTSVYSGATHWLDDHGVAVPFADPLTEGALVWVRPEGFAFHPIDAEQTAAAVEVARSLMIVNAWKDSAKILPAVNADPIRKAR
jgi:hypothetical protein